MGLLPAAVLLLAALWTGLGVGVAVTGPHSHLSLAALSQIAAGFLRGLSAAGVSLLSATADRTHDDLDLPRTPQTGCCFAQCSKPLRVSFGGVRPLGPGCPVSAA
jgi:hypothetical protein